QPTRGRGDGSPGADAPTHIARSSAGNASSGARSAQAPDALDSLTELARHDTRYPEWDGQRSRYRPAWCTVVESDAPPGRRSTALHDGLGLRGPLTRLGLELMPCRRRPQGDDIDIDAAVEARVDQLAGSSTDGDCYIESLRRRRDLSVLVLLDV